MFDVRVLNIIVPLIVKVMDFASYLSTVVQVKRFIDLGVTTLAQEGKELVFIIETTVFLLGVDAIVFRAFLIPHSFEFMHVS
jgi:hypothetical protein